jgi:hypothetical protein
MLTDTIKYRTGTMTKRPAEMTAQELKIWQEQGEKEIREYLFSINQPLIYSKNGVMIAENKDGSIEVLQ